MTQPFFRFTFHLIFSSENPNWFDILSLIVTVASIIGAYLTSRYFYKKEKKDSDDDKLKITKAEINLFDNSISELKKDIQIQIDALKDYITKQDFSLSFNPNINVEFLKYIDIKTLYEVKNIEQKIDISIINELLSKLFFLKDFQSLLRNEVQVYIKRYNELEANYYDYKKLLYTEYFKLINKRVESISIVDGKKIGKFHNEDVFIREYDSLRNKVFSDTEIINNESIVSRKLLDEKFIVEVIHICEKFIPEDVDAIEFSSLANNTHSAFTDMEHITEKHINVIESYKELLEKIIEKINLYQKE